MPSQIRVGFTIVLGLFLACAGCDDSKGWDDIKNKLSFSKPAAPESRPAELPIQIRGTVAAYAVLVSGGQMTIQGYGLVVGLGRNGATEVPPHLEKYYTETLLKEKLHSWQANTQMLSPQRILQDPDTAPILIGGTIPPGAPTGTKFDIYVSALPQTSTKSLTGGVLLPADMHMALAGSAVPGGRTRAFAEAKGSIFLNPFLDPTNTDDAAKQLQGRIMNGGTVTLDQPIRLQLRQADYARARLIERRINARFPGADKVANARSRAVVELTIPKDHRQTYEHFIDVVLHIPVNATGGALETLAIDIAKAMEAPDADCDDLALAWEGAGQQIIPILASLYASKDSRQAFYSARTGLRLGDGKAAEVLMQMAATPDFSQRLGAIEELGRHPRYIRSVLVLRTLLEDSDEQVRVCAYQSLSRIGDEQTVTRIRVGDEFTLDVVDSKGPGVIYASQTGEPRIVLFGKDLAVAHPVFFAMPDDMVTIDASPDAKELSVFRKMPTSSKMTPPLHIDFSVTSLIRALGSPAQYDNAGEKIIGLNLTYGQVVSVLYPLCQKGDISAKFVLQPLPAERKIQADAASTAAELPEPE